MIPILRLLRAATGSDRHLLDRFTRDGDEEAFEALVQRYGTGVWAACVRLAGPDAEDAFQAVFLILSRKAGSVTGSVPAWLHAVTRRVTANFRRNAQRRSEVIASVRPAQSSTDDVSLRDGLALLDEELSRLPERYRSVLIVCCLQGRSRDEAAAQLGWSEGQVKGRLERARKVLRDRLARRGVELGGLLLAAAVAGPVPLRADPPSPAALTLTQGVIRAMLIQKIRMSVAVLAACVVGTFACGVMLWAGPGEAPSGTVDSGAPSVPNGLPKHTRAAASPPEDPKARPQADNDESVRKEIEALRRRIQELEATRRPPAPEQKKIVATTPRVQDVVAVRRYVCQIAAQRHINVCALASGVVAEVFVKEGQRVKKGEVLFKEVPTLAQARLDAERAEVQVAEIEFENTKKLFDQKVASKQELTMHESKLEKARAKARLAEVELNFTVVRAPFDGLVGRPHEQAGSVVKEGATLTTLSDNSAVRAYFHVSQSSYLEYMAHPELVKEGLPVELVLANGSTYPEAGKLAAIDGQFDKDTGTIAFRADFPNPDHILRHGQTGTVSMSESLKNVMVIPQRAAFEDAGKRYVYVVGKDGVVHQREIVVRNEMKDIFVVEKGLDLHDRIIVDGLRQVHDGENVEYEFKKPEEVIDHREKHTEK